jgi:hypothetical protein
MNFEIDPGIYEEIAIVIHSDEGAKVIVLGPIRNGLIDLEDAGDMRMVELA